MNKNDKKKGLFIYLVPSDAAYQVESKSEYNFQLRPKLGLLYLAAALKNRKGITCEIWDQTVSHFELDDLLKAVATGGYLFLGFYSAISMDKYVKEFVSKLKNKMDPKIPILLGGPSYVEAEGFLKAGCDIVCNGEGEDTICDIVDYIQGLKALDRISGISYLEEGNVVNTGQRPLIADLDSISFPDFSLVNMNSFHDFYIFTMRKPYTTMLTSRGCPFNCSFCECPSLWGRCYRLRSVDNVLAEIDKLVLDYGVKYIAFQDDVFGMDYEWTERFCRELQARRYDLRWMCILHPFSFRKDRFKMLEMLRDAGCDTVSCGLQSAHPDILKRINRHIEEPDCIRDIVKSAKKLDMLSSVGFIVGSPGETQETVKTSVDFAFEIKPNYARFYNLVVLPGSEIGRQHGKGEKLCDIPNAELERLCRVANRKFFMDPSVLFRNLSFIIRRNPGWFLIGARYAYHVLDVIGMGSKKHKEGAI